MLETQAQNLMFVTKWMCLIQVAVNVSEEYLLGITSLWDICVFLQIHCGHLKTNSVWRQQRPNSLIHTSYFPPTQDIGSNPQFKISNHAMKLKDTKRRREQTPRNVTNWSHEIFVWIWNLEILKLVWEESRKARQTLDTCTLQMYCAATNESQCTKI